MRQSISMGTRLVANPKLVLREEGEEGAVLFDPDTGMVRLLNSTAAAIYGLIDGRRTVSEIGEVLRRRYDEFGTDAETQVMGLLDRWHRSGIVGNAAEVPKR